MINGSDELGAHLFAINARIPSVDLLFCDGEGEDSEPQLSSKLSSIYAKSNDAFSVIYDPY